jgi:signal transduction histidine kinase
MLLSLLSYLARLAADDDHHPHLDIVRGEERVARVWHDPALRDSMALRPRVGSAAVLAVDNERLRAQLLAQVRDLRESRARVVAAADTARRTLERDLHDGAQQRLLALTLELRVAQAQASAAGQSERAERLHGAAEDAAMVVAELRGLAHGIHPAVLDQAGLDAALRALAASRPLPVTVDSGPGSCRRSSASRRGTPLRDRLSTAAPSRSTASVLRPNPSSTLAARSSVHAVCRGSP